MNGAVQTKEKNEILAYNHAENIETIKQHINYIRNKNAEYAVKIGKCLILAKENVNHGQWLEALEELDFTPRNAQRLMKIAYTFGDDLDVIEGLSQSRAYSLTTLPSEDIIQFKNDGIVTLPDGTTFTVKEFAEMSGKVFINEISNLRNRKNKEVADWKSRALNAEAENKDIKKSSEEREKFLKDYMHDKDATTAEKIDKMDKLLAMVESEKNNLIIELMGKDEKEYNEQEVLEAISAATNAINDVFIKCNNINLDYYNTKMKSKIASFIAESQQIVTSGSIKIDNFIKGALDK